MFAANALAAPIRLQPRDIVGDWISLEGCSKGAWKFGRDGRYFGACFDMIESGRWAVRDGDKLLITYYDDPVKQTFSLGSRQKIIRIIGFERRSDRTFMYLRFSDGARDKWMK